MANENLDLIDREKVYENACAGCTRHGEKSGECYHDEPCERLIFAFTVAAPVDARPVVHGRWIGQRCSLCNGSYMDYADADSYPAVGEPKPNYCPDCGAKMDGGNEDG